MGRGGCDAFFLSATACEGVEGYVVLDILCIVSSSVCIWG